MRSIFFKITSCIFFGAVIMLSGCSRSYDRELSTDELKEDLYFAVETAKQVHPNLFAYTSEGKFNALCSQIECQFDMPCSKLNFYKSISVLFASLGNGHTFVMPPNKYFKEYINHQGSSFALKFLYTGNKVFIKDCNDKSELPVGAEVILIDGQDAIDYLARIGRFFPSEGKSYNIPVLQRDVYFPMFLWLDKEDRISLEVEVRDIFGNKESYTVKPQKYSWVRMMQNPSVGSTKDYTFRMIPESNIGLIEINMFNSFEKFKVFLQNTFGIIQSSQPSAIIIDIRNNPGGDSRLGDELLKYLTDEAFSQFELAQVKLSHQLYENHSYYKDMYGVNRIGSVVTNKAHPIRPQHNP